MLVKRGHLHFLPDRDSQLVVPTEQTIGFDSSVFLEGFVQGCYYTDKVHNVIWPLQVCPQGCILGNFYIAITAFQCMSVSGQSGNSLLEAVPSSNLIFSWPKLSSR